ncbi:Hypothetical protein SMAX5B_006727 [Scophthalmus maximus]|uniref:Uncharacterized protein n=1 Tax=Scophthalmus maximus TaxID=52904 RepID=A0A2U9AVN7_SCOMX|nr:Hypothetical protein SMAX5B_006727 [Scophthalmus maximus]
MSLVLAEVIATEEGTVCHRYYVRSTEGRRVQILEIKKYENSCKEPVKLHYKDASPRRCGDQNGDMRKNGSRRR